MRSVAIIVGIAVVGLVIFGPFAMAHDAAHTDRCPLVAMSGESCMQLSQFFGHLRTMASVLEVPAPSPFFFLPLLAAFVLAVFVGHSPKMLALLPLQVERERLSEMVSSSHMLFCWERRLQHSPPFA